MSDELVELSEDIEIPEEISRLHEPATAETYDKSRPQDRSGMMFQAPARSGVKLDHRVHGPNGAILVCTKCKIEVFRVFCSATGPYMQIICANDECGAMYPVIEMNKPQMNTQLAKAHGLYTPTNGVSPFGMNRTQRRMRR